MLTDMNADVILEKKEGLKMSKTELCDQFRKAIKHVPDPRLKERGV